MGLRRTGRGGIKLATKASSFDRLRINRLRAGKVGDFNLSLTTDFTNFTEAERKYIVDIVGGLPTILMELDAADSYDIKKMYIYANNQVIA